MYHESTYKPIRMIQPAIQLTNDTPTTRKPGYYAGLLTSAFMMGRLVSAHVWGVVSDRYGRRLVLIVGLLSTAVLAVAFGFSTTLTWAFSCR